MTIKVSMASITVPTMRPILVGLVDGVGLPIRGAELGSVVGTREEREIFGDDLELRKET